MTQFFLNRLHKGYNRKDQQKHKHNQFQSKSKPENSVTDFVVDICILNELNFSRNNAVSTTNQMSDLIYQIIKMGRQANYYGVLGVGIMAKEKEIDLAYNKCK